MHDVRIEVLLLSIRDNQLRWRTVSGDLPRGCHPDARARELAGFGIEPPATAVIHSTSWRITPAGLVLTYVVLPDPDPPRDGEHSVPADARIVCSGHAAVPSPPIINVEHVLAHALRHLSLLVRTNPEVNSAIATHPQLWHAVMACPPDVAGQLVS